ncbi:MAG TPA: SDR family oxidoreductase [Pseudonocardiaceae bacterium]|jgi:short-subunit dehydrogenase|nr:SDR family oxidoreductase [Pseudonocardiaceae bacterium]
MRRNILITGASSGLGAQMAREFAARGRNLALCARRTDRLEELRTELTTAHAGITVAIRKMDVAVPDQVFDGFRALAEELGSLDRVIVNAGIGKGRPIGTGRFDANLQTVQTNFVGALAQCEAAMEIFRANGTGHLVVVSSLAAFRGLPRSVTAYAATKAGVAALAEGIRADTLRTKIKVTTLFPGYIRSEMNPEPAALISDTVPAVRSMVTAMEREVSTAMVPPWPWAILGRAMKVLPLSLVAKFL